MVLADPRGRAPACVRRFERWAAAMVMIPLVACVVVAVVVMLGVNDRPRRPAPSRADIEAARADARRVHAEYAALKAEEERLRR